MNLDERPFAERLHSEVQRIPLPPRERWTPKDLSTSRDLRRAGLTFVAATVLVGLAVVVGMGVGQGVRGLREGAAPLSPSTSLTATYILASPSGLRAVDETGRILGRLVDLPPKSVPATPALSPNGRVVVFALTPAPAAGRGFGSDLYTVNVDGTGLRALVEHESDNVFYASPSFDPSGSFLYFHRRAALIVKGAFTGNDDRIERLDLRTGERRTVIESGMAPSVSPDGKSLAYLHVVRGEVEVWRVNVDGTNAGPFLPLPAGYPMAEALHFAPTGCELAFSSGASAFQLFVAQCDGSVRPLAATSIHVTPTWSPDGTQIAYVSAGNLSVVDVKTGVVRTLGSGADFLFGDLLWIKPTALRAASLIPATSSPPEPRSGTAPSTCGPLDPTGPAACLISGTLVEIVGHDGGLSASTALARVRLDDPSLSAQFGNPTLFETDAHTQIEPSAPSIAATGVKVGARVMVAFDGRAPRTSSGAYLLARFVVVSSGQLPDCLRLLDIARFPRGDTAANGGATPEAAFRAANPTIDRFSMFPLGNDPKAPVWIVAGTDTFIATILTDGTWFVSPAKLVRCMDPQEVARPKASIPPARTFPMNSLGIPPDPITPSDVAAGMPAGAVIFADSDPTCVQGDAKTYRCTLTRPPAPEVSDFLGAGKGLVIAGRIAGGCVGLDHAGMTWNCFLGQDAVDQGIIDKGFLGEPAPVPGRG